MSESVSRAGHSPAADRAAEETSQDPMEPSPGVLQPAVDGIEAWTDRYFVKTKQTIGRFGDKTVCYAVFMRRPVIFTLCLQCHNGLGNFGRTGTGVPLTPQSHNILQARFQNCTTCHVRIHGSNADPTFLR